MRIKKKLTYSSGEYSPQVLVRDDSTVAYSARNAGYRRRVNQVTKQKSLDPDTVRKFLKANPEFIDKHRGKVAKDKPERIQLLGDLRAAEINSICFIGGQMDKALALARNSPNLIAFCEAVITHLETVDCAEHISKDGQHKWCKYTLLYTTVALHAIANQNICYSMLMTCYSIQCYRATCYSMRFRPTDESARTHFACCQSFIVPQDERASNIAYVIKMYYCMMNDGGFTFSNDKKFVWMCFITNA